MIVKATCASSPHTGGEVIEPRLPVSIPSTAQLLSAVIPARSEVMIQLGKDVDIMFHELVRFRTTAQPREGASARKRTRCEEPWPHSPTSLAEPAAKANVKTLRALPLTAQLQRLQPWTCQASITARRRRRDIWAQFDAGIKKSFSGKVVLAQDRMILTLA